MSARALATEVKHIEKTIKKTLNSSPLFLNLLIPDFNNLCFFLQAFLIFQPL